MRYFERRRQSKDEARNVDEKLEEYKDIVELEDNDTKALIIAALTTILPIAIILVVVIWFLSAFIVGILR